LTSFDGEVFTGTVKVKLGPVNLTYTGKGRFVSKDDAAHRIVIEASGKDKRGTATAAATITSTLFPEGDLTRVRVVTDLRITGAPAQFGRGMIADVAGRLVGQFADCLAQEIAASPDIPAATPVSATAASATDAIPVSVSDAPPVSATAADPSVTAAADASAADAATGAAIVTTTAAAEPAVVATVAGITPAGTGSDEEPVPEPEREAAPVPQADSGPAPAAEPAATPPSATAPATTLAPAAATTPAMAATPPSATALAPAAATTPAPAAAPAAKPAPKAAAREVEPIDLLAVTGTSAAVRRTARYVVTFLAGAAVGALVVWLLF
jgi:carbon monoxide dehydrogenase subunit G